MTDIKHIGALLSVPRPEAADLQARNSKEDIINQIVARTRGNQEEHKQLAKLIAIWANRYLLNSTDLHALLKKADDTNIRNYGGFVRWAIKDKPRL